MHRLSRSRAVERIEGRLSAEALDQIWICGVKFAEGRRIGFAGSYEHARLFSA
jgi:hypothetical protein